MFDQYQSMMDSWEVLQRFEVSIPGSGHQHPLLWAEGLAQPMDLPPTHSQLHSPLQSIPLVCDSVSKPQTLGGAEKPRNHHHRVGGSTAKLEACELWSQTDVRSNPLSSPSY